MSFYCQGRLVRRASAALQLRAKIFRVTPRASAAIRARVFSGLNVAVVIVAAAGARTAVAVVPIAAVVLPAHDSNAVPAVQAALGMIAVVAVFPVRRTARSSSPRC